MTTAWASATAKAAGDIVRPTTTSGWHYRCTTAGTTGSTEPDWPTAEGLTVTDGTVTWLTVPALAADLQKLSPSAVVEMFIIDMTALGGSLVRYHPNTNELSANLTWQGVTYTALPIEVKGFEFNGRGQLPRPRLRVANMSGAVSLLLITLQDLVGAKVRRKRTLVKYLDAVNFTGGVNATADPTAEFPEDVFFIDRKVSENKFMVEFELAAAIDLTGVKLPRRQIIQNVCPWVYRGSECGYAGGAVADAQDTPTGVLADDVCGKRLASCKLRFGNYAELPFGGFPSAGLLRT